MQPHSMCLVALTNYYWNNRFQLPSECRARIEYRDKDGLFRTNIYRLYSITGNPSKTELSATMLRDGGGLSCTMHARRTSSSEGSLVRMTHDTIHVSGLEEEYKLWSTGVKNGRHTNSQRYGEFSGDINPNIPTFIRLNCELLAKPSSIWSLYELRLEQFSS